MNLREFPLTALYGAALQETDLLAGLYKLVRFLYPTPCGDVIKCNGRNAVNGQIHGYPRPGANVALKQVPYQQEGKGM